VIAALLTLGAIRIAGRPADREHNYGHRRPENIAALGEAGIVLVGGCIIAFEAIKRLVDGGGDLHASWYLSAVIGVALCIDITRIVISLRAAERYGSAAFRSNAFNFAGDTAGSLAVLVGLLLVAAGVQAGDAIGALFVGGRDLYRRRTPDVRERPGADGLCACGVAAGDRRCDHRGRAHRGAATPAGP
jgi:cation diffusion facilitator family transporter